MSQGNTVNPLLKIALEIGPLVVFFVIYQRADIYTATAVFVPLILAALGVSWKLSGKLPRMAAVTAVMVTVFGGLTLWLQDATFIKMKPTVVYLIFAGALGWGLMRGRSYLRDLMGETMPMTDEGWRIFTFRWALFFVAMAALNEAVWRSFSESDWVTFKTFIAPAGTFLFVMTQMPLLKRHGIEPEAKGDDDGAAG